MMGAQDGTSPTPKPRTESGTPVSSSVQTRKVDWVQSMLRPSSSPVVGRDERRARPPGERVGQWLGHRRLGAGSDSGATAK